jgi:hypothetical protein
VVLNRTEPNIQAALNIARYAKNPDIDRKAADANSGCAASPAPSRRWESGPSAVAESIAPREQDTIYRFISVFGWSFTCADFVPLPIRPPPRTHAIAFQTATARVAGPVQVFLRRDWRKDEKTILRNITACALGHAAPTRCPRGAHALCMATRCARRRFRDDRRPLWLLLFPEGNLSRFPQTLCASDGACVRARACV